MYLYSDFLMFMFIENVAYFSTEIETNCVRRSRMADTTWF